MVGLRSGNRYDTAPSSRFLRPGEVSVGTYPDFSNSLREDVFSETRRHRVSEVQNDLLNCISIPS